MAPYDDAVKAATEAMAAHDQAPSSAFMYRDLAEAAVAAAAPILLAAERARIAELEAVLADVVDGLLRDGRSPAMRCLLALNALIKHGVLTEHGERVAETAPEEPGRCKAHRDGECHWTGCPQVRDGEPRATGRHCPLDNRTAPEEES